MLFWLFEMKSSSLFCVFWSWWTWSFGVLIWCSTSSTAPTCSTGWCHDCTGTVQYATSTAPYDTSRLLASTTTTLYSAGAVYDTSTLLVLLPLGTVRVLCTVYYIVCTLYILCNLVYHSFCTFDSHLLLSYFVTELFHFFCFLALESATPSLAWKITN